MIEFDPDATWAAIPLWGEHPPPGKHPVKGHLRTLPGKHPPEDPENQGRLFEMAHGPPEPRRIPVRPHTRRNPRRKKEPMSMPEPIAGTDPVGLARHHDPETSHDAAERVLSDGSISRSQAWVLGLFRNYLPVGVDGFIDHDLERIARDRQVRLTPQRIRTARHDLYAAGYLRKTGEKRKTPYGRDAEVYALTEAGRAVTFEPYYDDRTDR